MILIIGSGNRVWSGSHSSFDQKNKKSVSAWCRLTTAVIAEDAKIVAVVDFNLRTPGGSTHDSAA
jgi:hypothetical protein